MTELIIPPHLSPDRFQKGLHFAPQDKTDMVELTFEERCSLFLELYPMMPILSSFMSAMEKTDIFCAMENNRIPTHREKDTVLTPRTPFSFSVDTAAEYSKKLLKIETVPSETVVEIDFNKAKE